MAGNQEETKARGTKRKAGNGRKSRSKVAAPTAANSKKTAPRATAKKAAAKKPAAKRTAKKATPAVQVSAEERYHMIQEAAYLRAEKEGFHCDPYQCWLTAEAEIDARLASSR
jgi:hypothetical protein